MSQLHQQHNGLTPVDYSTISKKASKVDYEISKTLFEIIISKCNRQMRRILNLPKQLITIDSTTVIVGENRLKWAKFKGKKVENSSVIQDITCYLGTNTKKTQNRFRVVEFTDYYGKSVKVCTDLMDITPEKIVVNQHL